MHQVPKPAGRALIRIIASSRSSRIGMTDTLYPLTKGKGKAAVSDNLAHGPSDSNPLIRP